MNVKQFCCAVSLAALALLSVGTRADGVYVSGTLGYATPSTDVVEVTEGLAYAAGVGYNVGKYFAIELDYVGLGSFNVKGIEGVEEGDLGRIGIGAAAGAEYTGFNLNVLLKLPVNKWDTFYLRAGNFSWNGHLLTQIRTAGGSLTETRDIDGHDPMVGLGYAFLPSNKISLIAEYNRYYLDDVRVNVLAFGVGFEF